MGIKSAVYVLGMVSGMMALGLPQAQQSPGTQPAQNPRPANPTPRTTPPAGQPAAQPDVNNPGTTNPNQPGTTNPNQPGTTNPNQPGATNPNQPGVNPPNQPGNPQAGINARYQRPFAFVSPEFETRFNENTQRLVTSEQRMLRTNTEMTRRLGEIRQMSPERQGAATLDLLQQILQDQAALQRYLTQARTAWSGQLDGDLSNVQPDSMIGDESRHVPQDQGSFPSQDPGTTANPPR